MAAPATLHEAMVEVLRMHGGGWMPRDDMARQIAELDLWRRPSDGRPPPSDQLRLRARKYQHLFECSDLACTRIRLLRDGEQRSVVSGHERSETPDETPTAVGPGDAFWYEQLRARYRPDPLRVLLVGESPPDSGSGKRRFFYSPELTFDNLYRGVSEAVYGLERGFDVRAKPHVLGRLQADGFWLIDAVDHPVNKRTTATRRASLGAAVPRLVESCIGLAPERGVIICHSLVYQLAAPSLRTAGVTILQDRPLPFPLGNWRAEFVAGMREALA